MGEGKKRIWREKKKEGGKGRGGVLGEGLWLQMTLPYEFRPILLKPIELVNPSCIADRLHLHACMHTHTHMFFKP